MAAKPLPSIETLRQLLRYEADTGKLYWLERPLSMFPNDRTGKIWNTKFAGREAFKSKQPSGHLMGGVLNVQVSAHRVAWALHYGSWPENVIDHINGNPADNRIVNLRDVSHRENVMNSKRRSDSKTGRTGVTWDKRAKAWHARIGIGPKQSEHLGRFKSFEEACAARKAAEKRLGYHANHGRAA